MRRDLSNTVNARKAFKFYADATGNKWIMRSKDMQIALIDEIENHIMSHDGRDETHYEISPYETLSGNPEHIYFKVSGGEPCEWDDEGEPCEWGDYKITF